MRHILNYLIYSLIIVFVTACGGGGGGTTLTTITSFETSVTTIAEGSSVNLTAVFKNGTASINNNVGAVSSNVAKSVTPTSTTTYILTVTNSIGDSITSSVTVTVLPAPTITSFTASSATIALGSSVNLTAVFSNGVGSIDNSVGTVTSNVVKSVTPTSTTTYILKVTNSLGASITSSVTVTVLPAFNIFPPGFFGGNYLHNITFTGSDTDSSIHTATLLEESGADTTFNSISVKTIKETLLITNVGGGGSVSGGLSNQYYTNDLNNLKYVGYFVGINNVATATSSSIMPITTYIGDSGTMGSYERSDGSTFTITWQLVADSDANAKYITTTVSRDNDVNATLSYTATVTSFINQAGTISKQTIVIIYHQESDRTLTLTSS